MAEPTPNKHSSTTVAPGSALAVALLGFFVVTLDALVVNVALPAISDDLEAGIADLQWVVDGYTLTFAALLLFAGTLADRTGADRAYRVGLAVFIGASAACALAPSLAALVAARLAQGIGAAMMTPASLTLIREAYPDAARRARAIGIWAMGGAIAAASGPLLGGALTTVSWRLIFFINLPVGLLALTLLRRVQPSARRPATFDWAGQATVLLALTTLVYGLIETGHAGFAEPRVAVALLTAAGSAVAFVVTQARGRHPMVPTSLLRSRPVSMSIAIGFTFMIGFYGMVFLMSLHLQQERGLTSIATGLAFVPVTGFSIIIPVLAGRIGARYGPWLPVTVGQLSMASGLLVLAATATTAPTWQVITLMVPVGLGAGAAMPSATALLLDHVPADHAGTASGVLNTSRQIGGALAIAAFGALLAHQGPLDGLRTSLTIAGALLLATCAASATLRTHR